MRGSRIGAGALAEDWSPMAAGEMVRLVVAGVDPLGVTEAGRKETDRARGQSAGAGEGDGGVEASGWSCGEGDGVRGLAQDWRWCRRSRARG